MKVKGLYNSGKYLSQKFLDNGWTKEATELLEINKEYNVYGICFFEKDICMYLVIDKYLKPYWLPDELFEITNPKISSLWYFKKYKKPDIIINFWMICGYKELVNEETHNDDLMERKPAALEIFYKRKQEMDLEFPDNSIKEKRT